MKRDFDLLRKILKECEAVPVGTPHFTLENTGDLDGYNMDAINEHLSLLIDTGFIEGNVVSDFTGISFVNIFCLTWQGHDFLSAATDTMWAKAKESVLKPGVAITIDVLFQWLKAKAAEKLGM
jgi:Hypothetical protein (DUF2513)